MDGSAVSRSTAMLARQLSHWSPIVRMRSLVAPLRSDDGVTRIEQHA
jgi:hypothetical protein